MAEQKIEASAVSKTKIVLKSGERVTVERGGNDNIVAVIINDKLVKLSAFSFSGSDSQPNGLPASTTVDVTEHFSTTGEENVVVIMAADWGVSANAELSITYGSSPAVTKTVQRSGATTQNPTGDVQVHRVVWK